MTDRAPSPTLLKAGAIGAARALTITADYIATSPRDTFTKDDVVRILRNEASSYQAIAEAR